METVRVILLATFLAASVSGRSQVKFRFVLRIHDLQDCGKDKAYGRLDNYTIVQRRDGGHSVNANVTLDRTCVQSSATNVKLHRCREALSYCEYYTTWTWRTALCSLLVMKNAAWTPVVSSFTPPLVCPVKKGKYTLTNATIDLDNFMLRTIIDGYVWRGVFTIFDQDDAMVICLQGAMQGVKIRSSA